MENRTRTRHALPILAAIGFVGILGTATTEGCIIPDHGIVVLKDGFKWCANAEGAQGWPDNDPGDLDPILDENGVVIQGCDCFDDDEHAKLTDWDTNGPPATTDSDYDQYVVLRDRILLDARTNCVDRANDLGFENNNCVVAIPETDDIFSNGKSGECSYEQLEVADTDDGKATEGDPDPFDLTGLSCRSATSCRAPQALIDDMLARPEAFLLDSTRIEIDADDSLLFTNVSPGDAAYIVGLRSNDRLLEIDGQDALSLEQVANLIPSIRDSSSATMKIKDGYGDEITISITVY